nr:MAG TPA: hypothetical protein [Caudoviricetes sp.]
MNKFYYLLIIKQKNIVLKKWAVCRFSHIQCLPLCVQSVEKLSNLFYYRPKYTMIKN